MDEVESRKKMLELLDTFPDTNVQPAEYQRLLGFPRDRMLEGRSRELADWARGWYAQHGRPRVYARQAETLDITNGAILIDGVSFNSTRLQKTLHDAEAHSVILVAVSAGPELEAEAQRAWRDEKPDEYFFLEIFGSAIVEHLTTTTGARLCAWAESHGMAVLPHYSPGYPEWDIAQQPSLLELLRRGDAHALPGSLEVLDSGMLRPKKSLLAVFGLTQHMDRVRKLTDLVPCENCSFSPCQFRRVPYRRAPEYSSIEAAPQAKITETESAVAVRLTRDAKYGVNLKALRRWTDERLSFEDHTDGTIDALFRYEGTTCTNMGRTLVFHYHVKLGPRELGYPILQQRCEPAPGDTGHTYMCRYMNNAEHLMVAIANEKPLLTQPLNDVLAWSRQSCSAGCYCEPASREHKWGLVLETIHFALAQREKSEPQRTGVAT